MIATLYVQSDGVYSKIEGVDLWDEKRDARLYSGPYSVVEHPPCAAWSRYSKPTIESKARGPLRGDDGGCFAAALGSVRKYGGVLEHPSGTSAYSHFGIPYPDSNGGWKRVNEREWVCCVEQGHYGHVARKPTWLFYVGDNTPFELIWGVSSPPPIGSGARRGNLESLSKKKRAATPESFARVLIQLAELSGS